MTDPIDLDPLLTPAEYLAHRRALGQLPEFPVPRAVIFAPQKSLAAALLRRHAARPLRGFLGEFHLFKKMDLALSTGFGVGAPVIAALTDEFTALGVRQFALVGMAGGLQPALVTGSLVVATHALREEGVSRHYLPPGPQVACDPTLTEGLSQALTRRKHAHHLGPVWTTDAPFRELRREVLARQGQGVLAVEMEAAAMLAVAHAYQRPAVAAFAIADSLHTGRWQPSAGLHLVQAGLEHLGAALIEALA